MTAPHDLDRQLDAFLRDGPVDLPDPSFDAVRDRIDQTRQRVVIGPWRTPDMNKLVTFGLGAAAVIAVAVAGSQLLGPGPGSVGSPASPTPEPSVAASPVPIGGTVEYRIDGRGATTDVTAVADGASVSGTAVTTMSAGTHTVQLECASRNGDTWTLAGTVEETTLAGERAGDWSVVIVRDGSPQQVQIWFSADPAAVGDCDALAANDFSTIEGLSPVVSGTLVPPPDLAP
jgi:hypothetical protein